MRDIQPEPKKPGTSSTTLAIGLAIGLVALGMPHLALASSAGAGGVPLGVWASAAR